MVPVMMIVLGTIFMVDQKRVKSTGIILFVIKFFKKITIQQKLLKIRFFFLQTATATATYAAPTVIALVSPRSGHLCLEFIRDSGDARWSAEASRKAGIQRLRYLQYIIIYFNVCVCVYKCASPI